MKTENVSTKYSVPSSRAANIRSALTGTHRWNYSQ